MSESTQEQKPVDQEQQPVEIPQEEPKYSKAEFDKILKEAKKYKDMAKEHEKQLKARELQELEKNNEWQRIAQMKEDEAKAAREEADKLKTSFVSREKMAAVREAAISSGLRKESIQDLRLIDFPEIKLETNDEGEFIVSGADKAVMRLKSLRPHWFQTAAPTVNTQTPTVTNSGSNISWADFKKIEAEYKKSPTRENEQKLRLAYSKVSV
jgi:hypothetical protein